MDLVTGAPRSLYKPSILEYEASVGEVESAYSSLARDTNPFSIFIRQAGYALADLDIATRGQKEFFGYRLISDEFLSAADARAEVQKRGYTLEVPDEGISRYELDTKLHLQDRERRRNLTLQRPYGTAAAAAGFAASLYTSVVDPINIASAFIPVIGEARYAAMLAKASGFAERAALRAGVGALEGTAGAALVEPLVYFGARADQLDYSLADSFANVVLGGALGGGLHVIGGSIYDRVTAGRRAAVEAPISVRQDALQGAVASLEEGRPVRAAEQIDATLRRQASSRVRESAPAEALPIERPRLEISMDDVEYARGIVDLARGDVAESAPQDILSAVRGLGGISLRDAGGVLTREGQEVASVLKDAAIPPGVINNRTGMRPDYMREALAEQGWFGREGGDIQSFYDALSSAARGEKVTRPDDVKMSRAERDGARMELEAAGVTSADSRDVAAGKLARYYDDLKRQVAAPREREPGEDDIGDADAWDRLAREDAAESEVITDDAAFVDEDLADLKAQIDAAETRGVLTDDDIAALNAFDELDAIAEREKKIIRAAAMCLAEAAE